MKIIRNIILLIFILTPLINYAQNNRSVETHVADILAQMPTKNLIHRDKLMLDLLDIGEEGFNEILSMVKVPGEGDDTQVRFAVNSLCRYVSQFDKTNERAFIETNLNSAIKKVENIALKTFFIRQLNLVGSEESLPILADCLINPKLTEPAIQALLSIGAEGTANLLLNAMESSGTQQKYTIIKGLGELAYAESSSLIEKCWDENDVVSKKVILAALANIGDPKSYNFFKTKASEIEYGFDIENTSSMFVKYIDRLGDNGYLSLCEKICKNVLKQNKSYFHVNAAVVDIYTEHFGYEAIPLLEQLLDSSDPSFRKAILESAKSIGGVVGTRKWIDKAKKSPSILKAEIIEMLGERGDISAINYIESNYKSSNKEVREASIRASVSILGQEALPLLANHLSAGNDLEIVKEEILHLIDKEHLFYIEELITSPNENICRAAIQIIATKSGSQYFNQVYSLLRSESYIIRSSAFAAIKFLSMPENIPLLSKTLIETDDSLEFGNIKNAIINAANHMENKEDRADYLLRMLSKVKEKDKILSVLPYIPSEKGLEIVQKIIANNRSELKESGLKALLSWQDPMVLPVLYDICLNYEGEYRMKAICSYAQLLDNEEIPADQRLLLIKKIAPFAKTTTEKESIIQTASNANSFLTMLFLERYIDDETVQQSVARGIMKIALPGYNKDFGYEGETTYRILSKLPNILKGSESDYEKQKIKSYLNSLDRNVGYKDLTKGDKLKEWIETSEKAENIVSSWNIDQGVLKCTNELVRLTSLSEFQDFELVLDWRNTGTGQGSISFRDNISVKICDERCQSYGTRVGTGRLYIEDKHILNPLRFTDNPDHDWNTLRITVIGESIDILVNGKTVVDNYEIAEDIKKQCKIFTSGKIHLASDKNVMFRNIYIKEFDSNVFNLLEEEKQQGFESLFNGRNLEGWLGNKTDYFVENGEIVIDPQRGGGGGNLYTEKEYSNFILRFDFQLTPGANNGLGIRAPLEGDAAYAGMELQILDNTSPIYANIKDYQFHGSVYGVIPALKGYLKPVGEWNSQEVIADGYNIKIVLNGVVILNGNIKNASKDGTIDKRNHPGLLREKGHIGFLGHGSKLKFRNIRILEL